MRLLLAAVVATFLAAGSALAKEGTVARPLEELPTDASPGEVVTVRFELGYEGANGWESFSACGIKLRIRATTGEWLKVSTQSSSCSNPYTAAFEVPEGGIAELEADLGGLSMPFVEPLSPDPLIADEPLTIRIIRSILDRVLPALRSVLSAI